MVVNATLSMMGEAARAAPDDAPTFADPTPPPAAPDPNWAPPPPAEPDAAEPPEDDAEPGSDAQPPDAAGEQEQKRDRDEEPDSSSLQIYGHVMTDTGVSFGDVSDPEWFDVLRPSKLPSSEGEFGEGPRAFLSVRQSRFGVKSATPTRYGELETLFEWELFGVGVDAGETTFRLRHAYASLGQLGAGQYWSPFMDIDVFPNSIEYWGPNAMVFFRNVQVRWMPIQGDSHVTIALERPGADADLGPYEEDVELAGVVGHYPLPDLSAEARWAHARGYVELAGIVRSIGWKSTPNPALNDTVIGWGLNLSSNLEFLGDNVLKLAVVYGEGIQSYMNDGGADIGVEVDPSAPGGMKGVPLPILTGLAFVDVAWSKRLTSSIGWGGVWIDNSNGQEPDAFHVGHYALANLSFKPRADLLFGIELQHARRESFEDGFRSNGSRIQFSAKFSYSKTLGGH